MRKWLVITLVALAVVWIGLNNVGGMMALSDMATRPILALTKDGQRVPVYQFGQSITPEMARHMGGIGVHFGYRFDIKLPGGETVVCTIRFQNLGCNNGWTAERAILAHP